MKTLTLWTLLVTLSFGMSNQEVADKVDHQMHGFKDSQALMKMILINSNHEQSIRTMRIKILEKKGGDKSLIEFLTPNDVKGTKFLSYEHIDKDDDQWLYIPSLKRVKRIASRNKSGSFMASEFSYEDLSAFNMHKYRYQGSAKEGELDGKKVLIMQRVPKLKSSGYSKIVSYVDQENFLLLKSEYFDKKGKLLKVSKTSDYIKIEGLWRVGKIEMKNVQKDKETILIWSKQKIKTGLSDKDFHRRVLKQ